MQFIRYLNLFEKICKVRTKNCFPYNNFIVFAVQPYEISKSIGEDGKNIKKIVEILGKKVKVVGLPHGEENAREFISAIISPFTFKDFKVEEKEMIIEAGKKNKAALIGRGKTRLAELSEVVKQYFNKELRIV